MNRFAFLIISLFAVFSLGLVIWMPRVLAGETSASNNSSASCMNNGVRPSPYTGGAGIARVFYPGDGSTVTVTTTGAVIKQSPCGTPYREGWVNTSDICDMNSSDDLNNGLRSGGSNPYTNNNSSSRTFDYNCNTNNTTNTSNNTNNTNTNNNNSSANANASAIASATASTSTPVVAAARTTNNNNTSAATTSSTNTSTTNATTYNGKSTVLPNTGPGDVVALGGVSTFLGTIGHYVYRLRRNRLA